ncbi:conserved hypothetical protein [groundwater metagenome]|uniref:K Homology domain-containing protein n=1 Tax=groundwater metagenome TaxID=717931 RepID=A0A098E6K8_9ZZZZ
MQYTKIAEDRIGVLIGKDGEIKKKIEEKTHTKITVTGTEVDISGSPYYEMLAENVVDAISLGFSPEKAILLTKEYKDYTYEFIFLSEKKFIPLRGMVIGTNRSVLDSIEKISECYVCVGKEGIGIIGDYEDVEDVKEAILMLINHGKPGTAYGFLDKRKKQRKDREMRRVINSEDKLE